MIATSSTCIARRPSQRIHLQVSKPTPDSYYCGQRPLIFITENNTVILRRKIMKQGRISRKFVKKLL